MNNHNDSEAAGTQETGMIAWFARNGVAANLLMFSVAFAGIMTLYTRSTLEVFPEIVYDIVTIRMPYRGATPSEVEEGVIIKIEEAIQAIEGIKQITSTASEGSGTVNAEIMDGYDARELLDDIKNRVDGISTFPDETERPTFSLAQRRREVLSLVVHGRLPEKELRRLGERVRDDMTSLPGITQIDLVEVRPYEISIEVSEDTLHQYGLTFDRVVSEVRRSSLDLPAGSVKTRGGEILLRTKGQAYVKEDFEKILILTNSDGSQLFLSDIAKVNDGFEEEPISATFNGEQCVVLDIFRVGKQNAITIADTVKDYLTTAQADMPPGVTLTYWHDRSKIIKARLNTLTTNGIQGLLLVMLILTLFLDFRLAFWVCLGIPISFLGAASLMPSFGITINIMSLFAFIIVLGIVVDDAIVTGENIYTHLQEHLDGTKAAILGTKEVSVPVTFGVLTTVAAFIPLTMLEGRRAPIYADIPYIVIPVLIFSLIESKLVLPSHLKHLKPMDPGAKVNFLLRIQRWTSEGLMIFVRRVYQPVLDASLRNRYLTISLFMGAVILTGAYVFSGRILFSPFPRVESERVTANLVMPLGTPFEVTQANIARINAAAQIIRDKYLEPETGESIVLGIMATSGSAGDSRGQSNIGRVMFEVTAPEHRKLKVASTQLAGEWRKLIGPIPGVQELSFRAEIGRSSDPIDIQLAGNDFEVLANIAEQVKARLRQYPAIFDITDSFRDGKEEVQLHMKPEARLLGITRSDLGRQVRQAFFGEEAQRIQRGRDDVRVMVRYPQDQRRSIGNLEWMMIRTADGTEVPFDEVADARPGRGFASIRRIDRRKTVNVTADFDKEHGNMSAISSEMEAWLTERLQDYPGVSFSMEGEAREERENLGSLKWGLMFLLFTIYALLAIPFKSYSQPLIVMSVIPFGLLGAVIGHMIMGMNLSMMSIFGMLALTGVVVNDSLVLVDFVNRKRRDGVEIFEAVSTAGSARFRPILLTSLTTFGGLMPLLLEKSTQAQFLIPMAVSIGFGVLFATFVTLFAVPVFYMMLADLNRALSSAYRWLMG